MKVLVTGSAGFIGYHVTRRLLARGDEVIGIDNLNDYYDPGLKTARLAEAGVVPPRPEARPGGAAGHRVAAANAPSAPGSIQSSTFPAYRFMEIDLADRPAMESLFRAEQFDAICHLAAQAGVRYSLENPHAYIQANLVGFANILEGARAQFSAGAGAAGEPAAGTGRAAATKEPAAGRGRLKHLVYASSSSVYGMNAAMPFSTGHNVDHPISLYAATKKSNELTAHSYSYLYGLPTTGLRFFTVYGPWGRPDMAPILFTSAILEGRPIKVFNYGNMKRDFSYVDDVAEGVLRCLDRPARPDPQWNAAYPNPARSSAPYRIYNIGNGSPVGLMAFIETLERALGRSAEKEMLPLQPGDVSETWADTSDLERDTGYRPDTPIEEGIEAFVRWYREFYGS